MDEAQGPESSVESLTTRILVVNFLSIHVGPNDISLHTYDTQIFRLCNQTSASVHFESRVVVSTQINIRSQSFTHALLHLAANSEYIQPLREEVEDIVKKEGWSKVSLSKMRKVDSFLRECQRIYSINCGIVFASLQIYWPF